MVLPPDTNHFLESVQPYEFQYYFCKSNNCIDPNYQYIQRKQPNSGLMTQVIILATAQDYYMRIQKYQH